MYSNSETPIDQIDLELVPEAPISKELKDLLTTIFAFSRGLVSLEEATVEYLGMVGKLSPYEKEVRRLLELDSTLRDRILSQIPLPLRGTHITASKKVILEYLNNFITSVDKALQNRERLRNKEVLLIEIAMWLANRDIKFNTGYILDLDSYPVA
jgi:hypothetical protein